MLTSNYRDATTVSARHAPEPSTPKGTPRYYVTLETDRSLATQCAEELFSLSIDAIAAEIDKIGGGANSAPYKRGSLRVWDNPLLSAIAAVAKDHLSLSHEEALTLVVPSFSRYDILPATMPVTEWAPRSWWCRHEKLCLCDVCGNHAIERD